MEGVPVITAVSSVIASTVKIAEKTFEICAVDDQAKAVLQTVNQVTRQLNNARLLRRQKSSLFTRFEKDMMDDNFRQTDDAVQQVASLTERARVDMEVLGGKVKMNTRLLYVLRDSPNIHISLTKLGIANSNLNMVLFMLTNREHRSSNFLEREMNSSLDADLKVPSKPPPTYAESNYIAEQRVKNAQRRASAQNLDVKSLGARSRSTSSLFTLTQPCSEKTAELEGIEPERLHTRASSKSVPTIQVSQSDSKADEMDFLLFQEATSFTPPPTTIVRPPPIPPFPPDAIEKSQSDFESFLHFRSPPEPPRPKSTPAEQWQPPPSKPIVLDTVETQSGHLASLHISSSPEQRPRGFSKPIEMQSDDWSPRSDTVTELPSKDHGNSIPAWEAWQPNKPVALPKTIEAQSDDLPVPAFLSSPSQRPRGWSSSARLQANELHIDESRRTTETEAVYSGSTYPPLHFERAKKPPYPRFSPVLLESRIGDNEQARQEANERYIDWYSPDSLSHNFGAVASFAPPLPPGERKGRAGKWYQARCD